MDRKLQEIQRLSLGHTRDQKYYSDLFDAWNYVLAENYCPVDYRTKTFTVPLSNDMGYWGTYEEYVSKRSCRIDDVLAWITGKDDDKYRKTLHAAIDNGILKLVHEIVDHGKSLREATGDQEAYDVIDGIKK